MPGELRGFCDTCRLWGFKAPKICALYGIERSENDYCSEHRRSLPLCEICGNPVIFNGYINEGHLICATCFSNLDSCKVCRLSTQCAYETDPSPLEKQIQKQVRQGSFISVTTTMNPERIRITCEKGCLCWDTKKGCRRQSNSPCPDCEVKYNND